MNLELRETLLVSRESVLNKEHNLWIGYSFGNRWFTKENFKPLIKFGLKYTKDTLLIWVPGRLYATNLKYIEHESRAESLKKAFEKEDKIKLEVEEIKSNLPKDSQQKILIANYDEIITEKFINQKEIMMREFAKQEKFYDLVVEISKEVLLIRKRTISKNRLEDSALYVLQELPLFLDGISKLGNKNIHTVVMYPGLGKLDELVRKIIQDDEFRLFREKLKLTNKVGIADVR